MEKVIIIKNKDVREEHTMEKVIVLKTRKRKKNI